MASIFRHNLVWLPNISSEAKRLLRDIVVNLLLVCFHDISNMGIHLGDWFTLDVHANSGYISRLYYSGVPILPESRQGLKDSNVNFFWDKIFTYT